MARLALISGGCRSGKSRQALELAEKGGGGRLLVATCAPLDEEMKARIARHQAERRGRGWETIEETIDLEGVLRTNAAFEVVLVDCLTLWINNLLHAAQQQSRELDEEEMGLRAAKVVDICRQRPGKVVLVTNEVGLGIMPENALARRFCDLVGRCNQVVAQAADEVIFMVSGLPLRLK
jgi:adenosylcobinamide kinase/adenosylcobinamide-phosphate guanylyltransferase